MNKVLEIEKRKTENIENLSRNIGPKIQKILDIVKRKTANIENLSRNTGHDSRQY